MTAAPSSGRTKGCLTTGPPSSPSRSFEGAGVARITVNEAGSVSRPSGLGRKGGPKQGVTVTQVWLNLSWPWVRRMRRSFALEGLFLLWTLPQMVRRRRSSHGKRSKDGRTGRGSSSIPSGPADPRVHQERRLGGSDPEDRGRDRETGECGNAEEPQNPARGISRPPSANRMRMIIPTHSRNDILFEPPLLLLFDRVPGTLI